MLPLTVDDILPLEEYASRRKEFFDSHRRYVERCRRVRIGPSLTLVFENRQTLWYRVHEVIRVARLANRGEVEQELNLYNRLLPAENVLQAALLIEVGDAAEPGKALAAWNDLSGRQLQLHVASVACPAHLVTCRAEDRCIGTAHWIQIPVCVRARQGLPRFDVPAFFRFDNGRYQHVSEPLSENLRQSLFDDLELSDHGSNQAA